MKYAGTKITLSRCAGVAAPESCTPHTGRMGDSRVAVVDIVTETGGIDYGELDFDCFSSSSGSALMQR
jgi:hypothetical protein